VTDDHITVAAKTGDANARFESQRLARKARAVHLVLENAAFSEVVGILENAQVAEEGLEPPTRGL